MFSDFPVRETVKKRRSVRSYEPRPLRAEDKEKLLAYRDGIADPFGIGAKIRLIETESSGQPKKLGTYGVIRGAGSFLGVVVPQEPLGLEAAGYSMEQLILYAASLGLGSCWLAATLNRDAFTREMQVGEHEWMPAISPVGYPAEKKSLQERLIRATAGSAGRKPWKELFFHDDFLTPLIVERAGEYAEALELLRLAPSATNAQPWRIVMDHRGFHFYAVMGKDAAVDNPAAIERVDLGIAACHFHLAAQDRSLPGSFTTCGDRAHGAPDGWRCLFSWVKE